MACGDNARLAAAALPPVPVGPFPVVVPVIGLSGQSHVLPSRSFLNVFDVTFINWSIDMRSLATTLAFLLLLNGLAQAQDSAECPWKLVTGKWRLSDDSGNSSTVVWKKTEGDALIGHWEDANGKATELVGWRPDKKELAAIGFGANGSYWNIVFTTVTESRLKGKITERGPDGKTRSGMYEITKESETKFATHFQWKAEGGKTESVKGNFTRLD
jgi:hypothetical protein